MTRNSAVTFALGALCGITVTAAGLQAFQSEMDPVKLSPQHYTVRIDNDRVRVIEFHLPSGQKDRMHSHLPGIVYTVGDAKLRTTLPDGSVSDVTVKTGGLVWREATTHALEKLARRKPSPLRSS